MVTFVCEICLFLFLWYSSSYELIFFPMLKKLFCRLFTEHCSFWTVFFCFLETMPEWWTIMRSMFKLHHSLSDQKCISKNILSSCWRGKFLAKFIFFKIVVAMIQIHFWGLAEMVYTISYTKKFWRHPPHLFCLFLRNVPKLIWNHWNGAIMLKRCQND